MTCPRGGGASARIGPNNAVHGGAPDFFRLDSRVAARVTLYDGATLDARAVVLEVLF